MTTAPTNEMLALADESLAGILRGWAKAYRGNPQYRFPSDPHAEFFPVDLDNAANALDRLAATPSARDVREALVSVRNWLDVQYNESPKSEELHKNIAVLNTALSTLDAAAPAAGGDDPLEDLVARFSAALLEKLKAARVKYEFGGELWREDDWEKDCQQSLLNHLAKGDPRDVAAYCAFMWHHGWSTVAPPLQATAHSDAVRDWLPIDSAPRDGSKIWLRDTKLDPTDWIGNWYVHPSVQGWVADELDCGDYEFSPTHWRPLDADLTVPAAKATPTPPSADVATDAQWLKRRTAETGVTIKNDERTRFLEVVRFVERHIQSAARGGGTESVAPPIIDDELDDERKEHFDRYGLLDEDLP